MRATLLAFLLVACGGDPVLRNAPRPNTAAVAGAAAAVAGAATLADPNGAARRQDEINKPNNEKKEIKSGPSVPADVLDRLDEKQKTEHKPKTDPKAAPKKPTPSATEFDNEECGTANTTRPCK
jgi:outer membrane biosynthesis protein TonB